MAEGLLQDFRLLRKFPDGEKTVATKFFGCVTSDAAIQDLLWQVFGKNDLFNRFAMLTVVISFATWVHMFKPF